MAELDDFPTHSVYLLQLEETDSRNGKTTLASRENSTEKKRTREKKRTPKKELQGAETFWIKQAQETLHGRLE